MAPPILLQQCGLIFLTEVITPSNHFSDNSAARKTLENDGREELMDRKSKILIKGSANR